MHRQAFEIHADANALSRAAAERIASILEAQLARKESATLVLTGGKTPKAVYELWDRPLS